MVESVRSFVWVIWGMESCDGGRRAGEEGRGVRGDELLPMNCRINGEEVIVSMD